MASAFAKVPDSRSTGPSGLTTTSPAGTFRAASRRLPIDNETERRLAAGPRDVALYVAGKGVHRPNDPSLLHVCAQYGNSSVESAGEYLHAVFV